MANDHVVEDFDLEELTSPDEFAGDPNVRLGWRRIAAGVIVREDDRRGIDHDRQPEDFARVDQEGVDRADGYQVVALDPAAGVEDQDHHALAFEVEERITGDVLTPVVGGAFRRVAEVERVRRGTFAQREDPVLVGLGWEPEGFDELCRGVGDGGGEVGAWEGVHGFSVSFGAVRLSSP